MCFVQKNAMFITAFMRNSYISTYTEKLGHLNCFSAKGKKKVSGSGRSQAKHQNYKSFMVTLLHCISLLTDMGTC